MTSPERPGTDSAARAGRVVIAGASGFIGGRLESAYQQRGWRVDRIGRRERVRWGDAAGIADLLDGADVLINLAGKSVNCRYTAANRAEILRSRVETTRELGLAIARAGTPPPLWINASTATIYRHAMDRPQTESTGEIGRGFSVSVATAWEEALLDPDLPGTRRIALRLPIVLGDGSALAPLVALTRLGAGGAQSDGRWFPSRRRRAAGTENPQRSRDGRQRFSWVHLDDVVRIIEWFEGRPGIEGPINAAAPNPETNAELMAHLRRILNRPVGLAMPRWMLELGSIAIRTESELVLKSRWVVPERLEAAGFRFEHPHLEEALRSILSPSRS
ncbi:DUF1731 domain-containing protein [Microcella daejeonensis]|uniref:epimerase n=1 Tax=Microcella daejeonensis TaxID=2994971 RepID=UPI0022720D3A|nr:DUF1731 domain-containing protein [Microcella daejeonensis]WAB83394.1 DUF1731 domain-containing protein [Microcella daejeonensis]